MNVQPNVAGTIFNYPFQGTMKDISGNGLDLATLDGNSFHVAGGVEQYGSHGPLFGFKFDGATKMWAPFSTVYQVVGPFSMEWLMYQPGSFEEGYMAIADPAGRSGGAAPDRIGSLISLFFGSGNQAGFTDENSGSNIPNPTFGYWPWASNIPWGLGDVHHYAITRSAASGGVQTMRAFVDGVEGPSFLLTNGLNTAQGIERLYIGGCEGASLIMGNGAIIGSMRMTNTERTPLQIAQDAHGALGPAAPTDTGIVYDAVAAAQWAISMRQSPRS